MFKPKINSIKKNSKMVGINPDHPEFAQMKYPTGNPSRKTNLAIQKPGRSK